MLSNPDFTGLKTQFVALDAEFNVFDFVQLCPGTEKYLAANVSSGLKDTESTTGTGLCLGFDQGVSAAYTENSRGVFYRLALGFNKDLYRKLKDELTA